MLKFWYNQNVGDYMDNKGFAISTIIYTSIVLLSLVMFTTLAIERNKYINQKDFANDINKNLSTCLKEGTC